MPVVYLEQRIETRIEIDDEFSEEEYEVLLEDFERLSKNHAVIYNLPKAGFEVLPFKKIHTNQHIVFSRAYPE